MQFGGRNGYAEARGFQSYGALGSLYTDIWVHPRIQPALKILSGISTRAARWGGLHSPEIPSKSVVSMPRIGYGYRLATAFAKSRSGREQTLLDHLKEFLRRCGQHLKRSGGDVVFCVNDALEVFEALPNRHKVLEVVGCLETYRSVLLDESKRHPEWEDFDEEVYAGLARKSAERDRNAQSEANCVVAPSPRVAEYVLASGVAASKVHVIPYWCEGVSSRAKAPPRGRKLRMLYVGGVSTMKGVPYLLEAMSSFPSDSVELALVGRNYLSSHVIAEIPRNCRLHGHVPHAQLGRFYDWADVFVFPSLCEGSALVVYEAIARGCPVITTAESGSIVEDRKHGYIIPSASAKSIGSAVASFLAHPERIEEMSAAALALAQRRSIGRFWKDLMEAVFGGNAAASMRPRYDKGLSGVAR